MLLAKPPAKPDRGVSIDESISRCNRTKLEVVGPAAQFLIQLKLGGWANYFKLGVVGPAAQFLIQLLHHLSGIQPSNISACLDTHSFSHALDTLPRWASGDVRPPGLGRIAPTKCVPQEIELFIRNPANPGLFFVHRQLQPVHHPSHGSERLVCTIALAADDQVSRPGESHPEALAELYVSLSTHTAPIMEPRRTPICQWANNAGERREMRTIQCVARR